MIFFQNLLKFNDIAIFIKLIVSPKEFSQLAPAILRASKLPHGLCIRHHAIAVADARTMSSKYDSLYSALAV